MTLCAPHKYACPARFGQQQLGELSTHATATMNIDANIEQTSTERRLKTDPATRPRPLSHTLSSFHSLSNTSSTPDDSTPARESDDDQRRAASVLSHSFVNLTLFSSTMRYPAARLGRITTFLPIVVLISLCFFALTVQGTPDSNVVARHPHDIATRRALIARAGTGTPDNSGASNGNGNGNGGTSAAGDGAGTGGTQTASGPTATPSGPPSTSSPPTSTATDTRTRGDQLGTSTETSTDSASSSSPSVSPSSQTSSDVLATSTSTSSSSTSSTISTSSTSSTASTS